MQRLEFLMRRFRQLVPQPLRRLDQVQARSVRCWLVDDVGPVLEDFVQRPRFRVQATWPLQTLGVGARTAERALVDQVDAALVDAGRILRQWARRPHLRQQLQAVAVEQVVTEETVQFGAGRAKVTSRTEAAVNRLPALLSQLDHISGRFWQDLVCREDYFAPTGGWMGCQRTPVQSGEWVVALNPELHPGGDFISRCLCRRVEVLTEILGDFGRLCAGVSPGRRPAPRGMGGSGATYAGLDCPGRATPASVPGRVPAAVAGRVHPLDPGACGLASPGGPGLARPA